MPRRTFVAILLAGYIVVGCRASSGWAQDSDTRVLGAHGKELGVLTSDGSVQVQGEGIGYWSLRPNHIVYFQEDYCAADCEYGYARMVPGSTWYVESFFADPPHVRTIGTVRRRTARIWDSYLGIGARARRVGSAVGPHPGAGAVARLVMPCWCS